MCSSDLHKLFENTKDSPEIAAADPERAINYYYVENGSVRPV